MPIYHSGLTIQRKSHLIAAKKPIEARPPEWRQPIWVVGFLIFIVANIGGTVFQIGALPIVMLAPLGAVSLLYNALLAKFLLHDALGPTMVLGTALILIGAVLVGYFGAMQEPPHTLDELLALFGRPAFIGLATLLFMALVCVLFLAHLADWQLTMQLQRIAQGVNPSLRTTRSKSKSKSNDRKAKSANRLSRRWSAPMLAPLDEVSETTSGVATPVLEVRDREAQQLGGPRDYGSISSTLDRAGKGSQRPRRSSLSSRSSTSSSAIEDDDVKVPDEASIARTRLALAVAFAAVSGTLSGLCLLLAKSGVELLVLTFGLGKNQFNRFGSWALVVIMIVAALAQLWYLNKALKMADPTLVCPLAFCFYNTSSIALGLVYFNQLDNLTTSSLLLVILGTAILLAGVFIVSTKPEAIAPGETSDEDTVVMQESQADDADNFVTSPSNFTSSPTETEALLANAAGIGGPHLPPPTSPPSKVTPRPQVTISSPDRSARRHRRSVSAGSVVADGLPLTAGLGLHLPSYYFENESDHRREQSSPQASPKRRAASTSAAAASGASTSRSSLSSTAVTTTNGSSTPNTPQSPSTPPQPHSRRPSQNLYSTILNRGLSIGIGPSSPGFHIGPFSPSQYDDEDEVTAEDNQRRDEVARRDRTRTRARRRAGPGRAKRTFSEADVDVESSAASAVDDSDQEEDEESGDDTARTALDDLSSLPRRLRGLTNRSWFSNARQWWKQNVTRVGEEEEQRRRERRALLA